MKKIVSFAVKHAGLIVLILAISAQFAFAGTGGTEFNDLYQMLLGWTTGVLGKTIALGAFLVGMGFTIVNQSLIPVAIGIGSAAALAYTPAVLDSVMVATLIF